MKFTLIALMLSTAAHAEVCADAATEMTVTGVATTRAYDALEYPVLVLPAPICYHDRDGSVADVYIVQLSGKTLPLSAPVTVRGKFFAPATARHFEKLLLKVNEFIRAK